MLEEILQANNWSTKYENPFICNRTCQNGHFVWASKVLSYRDMLLQKLSKTLLQLAKSETSLTRFYDLIGGYLNLASQVWEPAFDFAKSTMAEDMASTTTFTNGDYPETVRANA